MTDGAIKTSVHDSYVVDAWDQWFVLPKQAFGSLWLRKTQAMDCDSHSSVQFNTFRPTLKHLDGFRQSQLLGDLGKRIVVSPHYKNGNSGLTKPMHLLRKKPRRLHGCLVAVVKVSSD